MQVILNFNDGTNSYDFPYVQQISDPKEGMKATVIHGKRGDGAIIIPGGKRSQEIRVRGILHTFGGYSNLTTLMDEMRTKVTTNTATLTLKHYDGGWITDWTYTIRRIEEISFPQSRRTTRQEYEIVFIVLVYS